MAGKYLAISYTSHSSIISRFILLPVESTVLTVLTVLTACLPQTIQTLFKVKLHSHSQTHTCKQIFNHIIYLLFALPHVFLLHLHALSLSLSLALFFSLYLSISGCYALLVCVYLCVVSVSMLICCTLLLLLLLMLFGFCIYISHNLSAAIKKENCI